MRRTTLLAALLAVTVPAPVWAADADEEAILRPSQQLTGALVKGDVSSFESLLADDWLVITSDGHVVGKAQRLRELKSGDFKVEAIDKSEVKVRVYGDAAVVTGRERDKLTYRGRDVGGDFRFTEVYARQ